MNEQAKRDAYRAGLIVGAFAVILMFAGGCLAWGAGGGLFALGLAMLLVNLAPTP
jgi:hypothetical protein